MAGLYYAKHNKRVQSDLRQLTRALAYSQTMKKLSKKKEVRDNIKKIDRSQSSDLKKQYLFELINSIPHIARVVTTDQYVYRANKVEEKPSDVSRISYPPKEIVKIPQGRCNYNGNSVFYCSVDPSAALFEINPREGDLIALSKWKVEQRVSAKIIGYTKAELNSEFNGVGEKSISTSDIGLYDYINKYFDSWFRSPTEHFYELTSIVSEKLLNDGSLEPGPGGNQIEPVHDNIAILYPSIAWDKSDSKSNKPAHNIVFSQKAIDDGVVSAVEIVFGDIGRVEKGSVTFNNTIKTTDISDSQINW
ncbi:hypothetical protein [Aliamphritea ceti]|uniref:hypothetical protein n=1 Tax=Aliamphritea ceti TaxID=1524258 RepID=UPI0021C43D8C|nr:hypothetical protein [Aliamphritea ceti]